jgi:hypothetical protein
MKKLSDKTNGCEGPCLGDMGLKYQESLQSDCGVCAQGVPENINKYNARRRASCVMPNSQESFRELGRLDAASDN